MQDVIQIYLATIGQVEAAAEPGILELVTDADIIVQLVLLSLVGMSIACWVIILNKAGALRKAGKQTETFLGEFWQARSLDQVYEQVDRHPDSPVAQVFNAG